MFEPDFTLEQVRDSEALLVNVRSYFNLCAQEFFMHRKGVIEPAIWDNWEEGFVQCMHLPVSGRCASKLSAIFAYK